MGTTATVETETGAGVGVTYPSSFENVNWCMPNGRPLNVYVTGAIGMSGLRTMVSD